MKKKVWAILMALLLLTASGALAMTAGTYEAEGTGIGGAVKVAVTVSETAIEKVEVLAHSETAGICDPAIERIPADEKSFRFLMNEDAMATEKTAEGIRRFSADIRKLEAMLADMLAKA